ncbi:hypothetical protein EK21DRAFT_43786, partial [Setomelanomma holmii]
QIQGSPFAPTVWTTGGAPSKRVDIPAQTIFMLFFFIGAIVHLRIFRSNKTRGHKFLPSFFIFLFCISRVVTSVLRIAAVSIPRNIRLALAAQILMSAGVLVLFIINLIFARRIVRSTHRAFGWHPACSFASKIIVVAISATLILLIIATVQSAYSLDFRTQVVDRAIQLYGSTFLAVVATLPLPIVALTLTIPYSPLDEFGSGRTRTKVFTLLISTILLSIGAWYRSAITWQAPVPRTQPLPGYLSKAPFYILNFLFEFQTVIMYAIMRVDQRFHIPDGAKGPSSYSRPQRLAELELRDSRPSSADDLTLKPSASIHSDIYAKSDLEIDIEKVHSPTQPQLSHPHSRRTSLLRSVLKHSPSPAQKREWRASDEARIIRRLGGPWEQIPSPTESTYNTQATPVETMSRQSRGSVGTTVAAPSIRNTLHEDWTPEIEWELASPRRFLSLKKRSL